ncbi:tail fiber protein [Synechococcus elongatus IITB4]|uniref:tail fiber protein n=1 Tax=Synechococcus elongatus TaxID=32046 RepID=UPI0030CBB4B1
MSLPQENFQGVVDSLSEAVVAAGGQVKTYPPSYGGIVTAVRDLTSVIFLLVSGNVGGTPGISVTTDFTGNGTAGSPLALGATGVTAGTYGSATSFPNIQVDSKGRVVGVTVVDLGTIPEAVVTSNEFTGTGTNSLPLALNTTGVAAGTYGSETQTVTVQVDSKGRVTNLAQQTIRSASTSQTGIVRLSSAIDSTSETLAATAAALKQAYDLAFAASASASTANSTANTALTTANGRQPADPDLTAIAGLSGTGLVRRTGDSTFNLDSSIYLTGNQTITLGGDVSGSGSTSINVVLNNTGIDPGFYTRLQINAKGLAISGSNPTTLAGYGITDAQPGDPDLSAIAALTGTGLAQRVGDGSWQLDSTTYLSGTVGPTQGGTGQTTYVLGDILFASATNVLSRLAGNTTTARRALTQTGTGSASAAPAWTSLTPGDVGLSNVPNVDATNADNITSGTLNVARLGTTGAPRFASATIGDALPSNLDFYVSGASGCVATTLGGNAIDASVGNYFRRDISSNTTFTITNVPPTGVFYCLALRLTLTGSPTVSLGSGFTSVQWETGSAPQITGNKTHVIFLSTENGGSVWRASILKDFNG